MSPSECRHHFVTKKCHTNTYDVVCEHCDYTAHSNLSADEAKDACIWFNEFHRESEVGGCRGLMVAGAIVIAALFAMWALPIWWLK